MFLLYLFIFLFGVAFGATGSLVVVWRLGLVYRYALADWWNSRNETDGMEKVRIDEAIRRNEIRRNGPLNSSSHEQSKQPGVV